MPIDDQDVLETMPGRLQNLTLCAFKIAEDPKVLFPVMVNLDGFFVSHVVEPLYLLEKEELEGFIPPLKYPYPLDPKRPVTMGGFAPPVLYTESRKALEVALCNTKDTILRVWKEFGDRFGTDGDGLGAAGEGLEDEEVAGAFRADVEGGEESLQARCLVPRLRGQRVVGAPIGIRHLEQTELADVAGEGRLRHVEVVMGQRFPELLLTRVAALAYQGADGRVTTVLVHDRVASPFGSGWGWGGRLQPGTT